MINGSIFSLFNNLNFMENNEPKGYEVSKILDKKVKKGKSFYFIKWKGYGASQNSWQPQENLASCKQMVKKFNKTYNPKQKKIAKKVTKRANENNMRKIPKKNSKAKSTHRKSPRSSIDADWVPKTRSSIAQKRNADQIVRQAKDLPKGPLGKEIKTKQPSEKEISISIPLKVSIYEANDQTLIKDESLKVTKILKDKWGKFIYQVTSKGKMERISWKALVQRNFLALIDFYQSKIRKIK